jgi:hypothetical protein
MPYPPVDVQENVSDCVEVKAGTARCCSAKGSVGLATAEAVPLKVEEADGALPWPGGP